MYLAVVLIWGSERRSVGTVPFRLVTAFGFLVLSGAGPRAEPGCAVAYDRRDQR